MHSGCLFIGLLLLIGSSFFEGELTAVATGCGSANYLNLTEIHLWSGEVCALSLLFFWMVEEGISLHIRKLKTPAASLICKAGSNFQVCCLSLLLPVFKRGCFHQYTYLSFLIFPETSLICKFVVLTFYFLKLIGIFKFVWVFPPIYTPLFP